jgi:hypothetical protein
MNKLVGSTAITLAILGMTATADAKGCIRGAFIGGVAGHYTVHHGLLGAAAGCIIGRHEANKARREQQERQRHPARGETK